MKGKGFNVICSSISLMYCMAVLSGGILTVKAQTEQTNESLYLYIEENTQSMYQQVFDAYMEKYPEVDLQIDTYPSSDYANARAKLNTMLMAGEGPDLLLYGVYDNDDIYKVMRSGVFAPLDEYMAADEEFQAGNYVQSVMDAGIFGSAQYVIPLQYDISGVITSQECLEDLGFDMELCSTFDGFFSQLAALYDTDYDYRILADEGGFDGFPEKMGVELLDYANGEVLVDTPEMQRAMEQYKRMYQEDHTKSGLVINGYADIGQAITDRQTYFAMGFGMYHTLSICSGIALSETPVIIPVRTVDGKSSGVITSSAAVRNNSENQLNAWNMIRMILEYQAEGVGNNGTCFPVNQAGIKYVEEKALGDIELYESGAEVPQEVQESYEQLLLSPENVYFYRGITLTDFVEGKMEPYLSGRASYEDCMKQYVEYAKIYISE